jgi:hypothetical protein
VTAFGTASFMLGMYQTNILDSAGILIVLPAAPRTARSASFPATAC